MIVGEVKSGKARFNPTAANRGVLAAALQRFGCCDGDKIPAVAAELLAHGQAKTVAGHAIRLVAFGTSTPGRRTPHHVVTLAHMIDFLRLHLRAHGDLISRSQIMDPVLELLMLVEKSGSQDGADSTRASSRKSRTPRSRRR